MDTATIFALLYISEHGFDVKEWEPSDAFAMLQHKRETITINGKLSPLMLKHIDLWRLSLEGV